MKTLTEFDGFALLRAVNTKKELLAAGKTAEELPAAMGEALKLEGDKLTNFLNALEIAEGKSQGLKRVVVYAVEEGKSGPAGAILKGDKYFRAEFFFTAQPKGAHKGDRDGGGRGGRGGRDGDRKKKGGRGGSGRPGQNDRGGRPNRPPAPGLEGAGAQGAAAPQEGEGDSQRRRRPPRNRPPRPDQAALPKGNPKPDVRPVNSPKPVVAASSAPEAPADTSSKQK